MVGVSPSFRPETRKSTFSTIWRHFRQYRRHRRCFRASRGLNTCLEGFKELSGGEGKPRAPERWPESFGRSLYDDFQVEALYCQVWSFSVLLPRLEKEKKRRRRKEEKKSRLSCSPGESVEAAISLDGRVLDASG